VGVFCSLGVQRLVFIVEPLADKMSRPGGFPPEPGYKRPRFSMLPHPIGVSWGTLPWYQRDWEVSSRAWRYRDSAMTNSLWSLKKVPVLV